MTNAAAVLFGICVGVTFWNMIKLLINMIKRRNKSYSATKRYVMFTDDAINLTRRRFSVPIMRPQPPEIENIKEG